MPSRSGGRRPCSRHFREFVEQSFTENTTTGWLITDGYFTTGSGEWHNGYADLSGADSTQLYAYKLVNGVEAVGDQKFDFKFELYDSVNKKYVQLAKKKNDGGIVYLDVNSTTPLHEGWNVFRITETDQEEGVYERNNQEFYAVVKYVKIGDEYFVETVRYFSVFNQAKFLGSATTPEGAGLSEEIVTGKATFNNHSNTGNISIEKEVDGLDGAATTTPKFLFDVSVKAPTGEHGAMEPLNGVFAMSTQKNDGSDSAAITGMVQFKNGKALVEIPAGYRVEITGIPTSGTTKSTYSIVEEATEGYFPRQQNNTSGEVTGGETAKAKIVNCGTGSLAIEKIVSSSKASDMNQEFTFTVTLYGEDGKLDENVHGHFGDLRFVKGKATVKLTGGDTVTATGLPAGDSYVVTESEDDSSDFRVTSTGDTGSIEKDETKTAVFINARPEPGALTVKKSVESSSREDLTKEYEFEIVLGKIKRKPDFEIRSDSDNSVKESGKLDITNGTFQVTPEKGYTTYVTGLPDHITYHITSEPKLAKGKYGSVQFDDDGKASYESKSGDTRFISNLPAGVTYTITMTIDGKYGDILFNDGKATVRLKNGESLTADTLPKDIGYTVTETTESSDGFDVTKSGDTGTIADNSVASFVNKKETTACPEVTLTATKKLTGGKVLEGQQFEFSARRTEGNTAGVDQTELKTTIKNDAQGNVNFGKLKFIEAGTYVYEVKETSKSANGIVVDDAVYTVTYTVSEQDGRLSLTSESIKKGEATANAIEFINTYKPSPVTVSFTGVKTLLPKGTTLSEGQFSFEIVGNPKNPDSGADEKLVTFPTNRASGAIDFGSVQYTAPGTWTYAFKETKPSDADKDGILYDSVEHTVVVVVSDDGNGALRAKVKLDGTEGASAAGQVECKGIDFENTQLSGSAVLEIKKEVIGSNSEGYNANNEYEFKVERISGKTTDTLPRNVKAKAGDRATFGAITYSEPGTYVYQITEVDNGLENIEYDCKPRYAKVVVTKNTTDKKLDTVVTYSQNAGTVGVEEEASYSNDVLTVTNTYTKPAEGTTSVRLMAEKTVDGAIPGDKRVFDFSLTPADTNPKSGVDVSKLKTSAKNDANGEIDFGTITFSDEGTWVYTVREASATTKGITPDQSVFTVTCTTTKSGNELHVQTVVTKNGVPDEDNDIEFDNTYHADATSVSFSGAKTLLPSGSSLTAGRFSFLLKGKSQNVESLERTVQNDANGKIDFGSISYNEKGTYVYEVSEIAQTCAGVACDARVHTVTVDVTDNHEGKLMASVKVDNGVASEPVAIGAKADGLDFTNTVLSGSATLSVTKAVAGNTGYDKEEQFRFMLSKAEGSSASTDVLGSSITAETEANSRVSFAPIIYTEPGTYYYTITESAPVTPTVGMTYDTNPRWAKVVVERGNAIGEPTLKATKIVYGISKQAVDSDAIATNSLTVTNTFGKTTYAPSVVKVLEGDEAKPETYVFHLNDVSEDKSGETFAANGTTASVTGPGTATFPEIAYTKPGTYTYEITENNGGTSGMQYSTGKVVITVPVSAAADGALVVGNVTVAGGDTGQHEFKNTYEKAKLRISGKKTWVDGGKDHDNSKDVTLTLWRKVKNGEERQVTASPEWNGDTYTFKDLDEFDADGKEYIYSVREREIAGYTCARNGFDFVNTITGTKNVEGKKTWVGDPAGVRHDNSAEVTLELSRKSAKPHANEEKLAHLKPVWNGDTYVFSGLPKYDAEGYEYEYTVSESSVAGYITAREGNDFTNTLITTSVSVTKQWNDHGNALKRRPRAASTELV